MRRPGATSSSTHVLSLFALANLLSYASRNIPFAVYDDLRAEYAVDDGQLGWLGTAFILPHALATLPEGWVGDRVDRRRLVALGLVIASIGSVLGAIARTGLAEAPIRYEELEPYYTQVDWEVGVSGAPGANDPPRSRP